MIAIAHNICPRFNGMLRLAGTRSFRLACGKFFDTAGNTQNLHKRVAGCLVAPQGYTFVQCDQRSAESVAVAQLARPGNYRKLLALGMKPHCLLALLIFGTTRTDWFAGMNQQDFIGILDAEKIYNTPGWKILDERIKESEMEYALGKMIVHACSYRMGWRTFQLNVLRRSAGTIIITAAEAKHYLSMFALAFPEIVEWQDEVIFEARKNRILHNCLGYPRVCGRRFTHSYENELISFKPQSTVGCLTHLAVDNYMRIAPDHWHLLGNVHDAYVVAVPDAEVQQAARVMVDSFKVPLTGRGGEIFYIDADPKAGKIYTEMKKVKLT